MCRGDWFTAPAPLTYLPHLYGSVQYMQQPEAVFAEVYRVLKPGGVAIFTFSNRCAHVAGTPLASCWPLQCPVWWGTEG